LKDINLDESVEYWRGIKELRVKNWWTVARGWPNWREFLQEADIEIGL
jgi:hypothetical protein